MRRHLTVLIEKEDDGYVSLCPELDIASQGDTIEEAKSNLQKALELFFECASEEENRRRHSRSQSSKLARRSTSDFEP